MLRLMYRLRPEDSELGNQHERTGTRSIQITASWTQPLAGGCEFRSIVITDSGGS
jgi:hypothetical protein